MARRFRCGADLCGRRIFAERFEDGVLAPWARRTGRLDYVIHHLGLALGGRPAASFARRLTSCGGILKVQGFRGSLRVVTEWATRRRRAEKAETDSLRQIPSARTIARLLTISRDTLSKSETVTVAAIEDQVPLLVEAREIIAGFHDMIRRKSQPNRALVIVHWSNGPMGGRCDAHRHCSQHGLGRSDQRASSLMRIGSQICICGVSAPVISGSLCRS